MPKHTHPGGPRPSVEPSAGSPGAPTTIAAARAGLAAAVVCLSVLLFGGTAAAQTRPDPPAPSSIGETVTVIPAPEYEAGGLRRTLLGPGWRDVWTEPVDVTVFGLDRYAGGVDWTERGGGNQSITLHLEASDGWREYIFRSVNKYPRQGLPPVLAGTTVGGVVEDMIASFFPAAPLMVPPLLDAVGLLHVEPVLRIMPDDPRLGVYQDTFAGMLGTVELQANEAPGDRPGFAGSPKIKGSEEFLKDLEESKAHRLDEREFLAARLVDFLINDTDRTRDNMRWARFGPEGDYQWRPLPIDRDWAFVNARGWLTALMKRYYQKLTAFGPEIPSLDALTYSSHVLDRRLLQRLTREDFAEVGEQVRSAITDETIEAVIAEMPERWRTGTDAPERIREALRARREALPGAALGFYDRLAAEVDVRGTDEPDRALIERYDDGRVRVTITWPEGDPRAGEPFFERTFLPSETDEVRVYLHGGDDEARVTGSTSGAIALRVIGGGGDDTLVDEAGGGATSLYDARGENRLVAGPWTHVSTREWDAPEPTEGIRLGGAWVPDWGGERGWSPVVDYGDVAGVVLGFGPTWTRYGFRRLPYRWKLGARVLYALGDGSIGGELDLDYRAENSPLGLTLQARYIPFSAFRFNGYGNDTPDAGDAGLVAQDRVLVAPALVWHIGWRDRESAGPTFLAGDESSEGEELRPVVGRLTAGPVFLWTDPRPEESSPLAAVEPLGTGTLGRVGLRAGLTLDRTDRDGVPRQGWRLAATAAGYPAGGGLPGSFAEGSAEASAYIPLPLDGPHLAVRVGGSAATDRAPVQHAPYVGGRTTLRGYRWQRYRGDTAGWGSAELRVPVAPVELLVRWDLGVFGLVDTGRVWVDGESPGGWHTGYGGGVWLAAFGQSISAAYAYGDQGRAYVQLGLTF